MAFSVAPRCDAAAADSIERYMRKFTQEQRRQIAAVAAKKDADLDVTEMPEVVDWSGAERKWAGSIGLPKSR
jgi:hypothetical protein